jgi:hypothetical protein
MPTVSKPQLTEPESPWGAPFDRMYLELCQNRVPILTALGFCADRDLSPPASSDAVPTKDEEEELRQIASALTVAAAASEVMPPGVLVATLQKVSKQPSLFLARELTYKATTLTWDSRAISVRSRTPAPSPARAAATNPFSDTRAEPT